MDMVIIPIAIVVVIAILAYKSIQTSASKKVVETDTLDTALDKIADAVPVVNLPEEEVPAVNFLNDVPIADLPNVVEEATPVKKAVPIDPPRAKKPDSETKAPKVGGEKKPRTKKTAETRAPKVSKPRTPRNKKPAQ
jgi:hypothetical protein